MDKNHLSTITPGQYQYRLSQMLPWVHVRVFRESISNKEKLCVRLAGFEIDAQKLFQRGEWKAL
ncbi:hypothetical protein [Aliikangiella coralliicola]|uniref:Uncharacterized protein n=1 Tax=Aliikangiella coralliicola TaxID=2592383 RepID=A0A545UFF7_9GAMM|nr:hypothetical protein [Aliikangiella coralliicola]TQV88204.1 hypothetical protein FLL46_06660 [Aliikangiella coralliicola]